MWVADRVGTLGVTQCIGMQFLLSSKTWNLHEITLETGVDSNAYIPRKNKPLSRFALRHRNSKWGMTPVF